MQAPSTHTMKAALTVRTSEDAEPVPLATFTVELPFSIEANGDGETATMSVHLEKPELKRAVAKALRAAAAHIDGDMRLANEIVIDTRATTVHIDGELVRQYLADETIEVSLMAERSGLSVVRLPFVAKHVTVTRTEPTEVASE